MNASTQAGRTLAVRAGLSPGALFVWNDAAGSWVVWDGSLQAAGGTGTPPITGAVLGVVTVSKTVPFGGLAMDYEWIRVRQLQESAVMYPVYDLPQQLGMSDSGPLGLSRQPPLGMS